MSRDCALVFAGDEGAAQPLSVAMYSALETMAPRFKPELFVLDNGIAPASRTKLLTAVRVAGWPTAPKWLQLSRERLRDLPAPVRRVTPTTFAKLLIPELLPAHTKRAVYLDADVLVKRDISPLFAIDLQDSAFGAVKDFAGGTTDHEWSPLRGAVDPRPYFNAGVLVIDLERWRAAGLTERALGFAAQRCIRLPWGDQDALNAVAESWHELDYRWNVQIGLLFLAVPPPPNPFIDRVHAERWKLHRSAAVLHFAGVPKPWFYWYAPGALAWVRTLVRVRWYAPRDAVTWLLGWCVRTARYLFGTARRRGNEAIRERFGGCG